MKYPVILFLRWDKYNEVDETIKTYDRENQLDCTINIINNEKELNKLYSSDYHILVTYGESDQEYAYKVNQIIPARLRNRWIHKKDINDVKELNYNVNYCYINNAIGSRKDSRPTFSIFTSCYNSYEKLYRAYNSIKNQVFKDWEWVIMDDSPDDKHFEFLRNISKEDCRIRLYKRDKNSGNIGNVKNETIGLCRGQYVLEMDHDDEIMPDVLGDAVRVFQENEEVGFVYMETATVRENGENFSYGDFICKGYGGNYTVKQDGQWRVVYNTPNINNITLSHLVCLPNHPRIWRKSTLDKCGSYPELLPICDDYEIILRSCVTTKVAKVAKLGYYQYMNDGNSNFSLIRNGEINRIGPQYISPMFFEGYKVQDRMRELDAYEDERYGWEHSQLWKRDEEYQRKFCNMVVNYDFDRHYCLIGLESLSNKDVKELYNNERNDFILLDNKHSTEELQNKIDEYGYERMRCYAMQDCTEFELIKFFKRIYQFKDEYHIIADNMPTRDSIINVVSEKLLLENNKESAYLEIGVEYGHTFNGVKFLDKVGVDPDPKFDSDLVVKKTSDDFFATNDKMFDRIFIDGMHHSEYVMRDFNNSMKFLKEDGIIFIDDIVPLTEREQLRIPPKHYYENGILKYGESWTGDVWKVVYYLIRHYSEKFDFKLHQSEMYRGVGCFYIKSKFFIPPDEQTIREIQNYTFDDFEIYKTRMFQIINNDYKYNLSVCAVFKNEAHVLREWLEHYIAEGVEHFYLINNDSNDNYMNILNRYIKRGMVTLKHSSVQWKYADSNAHKEIFNENIYKHRFESKWMIMVDLDEFMYGRKGRNISEYLDTLNSDIGNVYVEWRFFTTNGHTRKPNGIVRSLTQRVKYREPHETPRWDDMPSQVKFTVGFGKSIFKSSWMHDEPKFWMHKVYTAGRRINNYGDDLPNNFYDPDNIPIEMITEDVAKEANLGLNHYVIQSKEELVRKIDGLDKIFNKDDHAHIQRRGFLVGCNYIENHPELTIEDRELADKRKSWSDEYNERHDTTYEIEREIVSVPNYADFYVYKNCGVCNYLKNGQIWEQHMHDVFNKYITSESHVLEAGCHVGSHSVKLAQMSKHVHYFEPLPTSFELLQKNLELNIDSDENYTLHNAGVGETHRETSFAWIPRDNLGGTGLSDNPQGIPSVSDEYNTGEWFKSENKTAVSIVPIDSLELEKLDFIKIDVEGYEPHVIAGAMDTIKRLRPVIIMECFKNHHGETLSKEELEEKYTELITMGYRVEHVHGPDYLFIPNTNIHEMHRYFTRTSVEQLNEKFIGNNPFDHIVIDGILDPNVLAKAEEEIRNDDLTKWQMHIVHGNSDVQVNKYCKSNGECCIYMCGPYTNAISQYFASDLLIKWMEQLTEIEGLQNDPEQVGGGIHRITRGGKLGIHADYNRNPRSKKYRRVNALLYLNSGWKNDYNGELELWNKDMTECVQSIPPVFNRMVVFRINDDAYHGHPREWNAPQEFHRTSFAFYYFTDDRPEYEKSESYHAQWQQINIVPGKDPYGQIKNNRQREIQQEEIGEKVEKNVDRIIVTEVNTEKGTTESKNFPLHSGANILIS